MLYRPFVQGCPGYLNAVQESYILQLMQRFEKFFSILKSAP